MKEIIGLLNEKLAFLAKEAWAAEKSLANAPKEGRIKVSASSSWVKAYLITKETGPGGKNVNKNNSDLLKLYCQRDYDRHTLKLCKALIKEIKNFLAKLPPELVDKNNMSLEDFLSEKNPVRRRFLKNPILSDKDFAAAWQSLEYKGKPFENDFPELRTDKGERVRSKSEMLIANKLAALGIPYRYEFPHQMRDRHGFKITVYPDFTILNRTNRSEIILEHFGRLEDPEYIAASLSKLDLYSRNGYFPGKNFLFTMETNRHPFDIRLFEKQIRISGLF